MQSLFSTIRLPTTRAAFIYLHFLPSPRSCTLPNPLIYLNLLHFPQTKRQSLLIHHHSPPSADFISFPVRIFRSPLSHYNRPLFYSPFRPKVARIFFLFKNQCIGLAYTGFFFWFFIYSLLITIWFFFASCCLLICCLPILLYLYSRLPTLVSVCLRVLSGKSAYSGFVVQLQWHIPSRLPVQQIYEYEYCVMSRYSISSHPIPRRAYTDFSGFSSLFWFETLVADALSVLFCASYP